MHRTLLLVLAVLLAGCTVPEPVELPPVPDHASGTLAVHYLSVGQGDATVWALPGGGVGLYDCGGGREAADGAALLDRLETVLGLAPGERIEVLVVSHGHLDHLRACEEVLDRYQVARVVEAWYTGADRTRAYRAFQERVLEEGATLHTVGEVSGRSEQRLAPPEVVPLGPEAARAGAQLVVLWPLDLRGVDWDTIAEASLVVRLSLGAVSYCFQGDIDHAQEEALSRRYPGLSCDVHLVGHHGSPHASAASWLAAIEPRVAVVSFGENPYGHPSAEALCNVQRSGAALYALHRTGHLQVATDGTDLTVSPDRPDPVDYCAPGADYWSSAPAPPAPSGRSGALAVEAWVDDERPCRHTEVTVHVRATGEDATAAAGANVTSTWHYKTTTGRENATTDARGQAAMTRYISGAAAGHEVTVEVRAWTDRAAGNATTAFTPRDCERSNASA